MGLYRTEKEEYIIGAISLMSNKLTVFAGDVLEDLTYKQWFFLMLVSRMEEEKNMNDIAEFVGTSRQNVKKMVTALERKGYIASQRAKSDKRATSIQLTDKAAQYLEKIDMPLGEEIKKLFKKFSDDEIEEMVHCLQKLKQAIEEY